LAKPNTFFDGACNHLVDMREQDQERSGWFLRSWLTNLQRARQVYIDGVEAIVERQQGMPAKGDNGFLFKGKNGGLRRRPAVGSAATSA